MDRSPPVAVVNNCTDNDPKIDMSGGYLGGACEEGIEGKFIGFCSCAKWIMKETRRTSVTTKQFVPVVDTFIASINLQTAHLWPFSGTPQTPA